MRFLLLTEMRLVKNWAFQGSVERRRNKVLFALCVLDVEIPLSSYMIAYFAIICCFLAFSSMMICIRICAFNNKHKYTLRTHAKK